MSVTHEDYLAAPLDGEGFRAAWASCRCCDRQVIVCSEWAKDGLQVVSTGRSPHCNNPKCGDKFPHDVARMATHEELAIYRIQWAWVFAQGNLPPGEAEEAFGHALMMADCAVDALVAVRAAADLFECAGGVW